MGRNKSTMNKKPEKETELTQNGGEISQVAEEERCKHPLEHTWSFWMQTNNTKNWEENLVEVTSFDTVEDFWCLYHYTKTPSELKMGQDYAIFKKGIRPMWEDKENKRGGRWLIMVEKGNDEKFDRIWQDAVLMLIGQNFEDDDSISGVVAYIRPNSKIGYWGQMSSMGPGELVEFGGRMNKEKYLENL